jgi:hypothetical protein
MNKHWRKIMTKTTFVGFVIPASVFAAIATAGYVLTGTHLVGVGLGLGFMLSMGQDYLLGRFS